MTIISSINWLNNPIDDLIQAVHDEYRLLRCAIYFDPELYENEKAYGYTQFDGDKIIIALDAGVPYKDLLEVLAHELAHAIAGKDSEHNDEWERIFDKIYELYDKYCENKYNGGELKLK